MKWENVINLPGPTPVHQPFALACPRVPRSPTVRVDSATCFLVAEVCQAFRSAEVVLLSGRVSKGTFGLKMIIDRYIPRVRFFIFFLELLMMVILTWHGWPAIQFKRYKDAVSCMPLFPPIDKLPETVTWSGRGRGARTTEGFRRGQILQSR